MERHTERYSTPLILILVALVLTGCVTQGYSLPKPVAGIVRTSDSVAVEAAVENLLRGGDLDRVPGVKLAPGARISVSETGFDYAGFAMTKGRLLRYHSPAKDQAARTIAGELNFEDQLGRRTTVLYYAAYRFAGGEIEIGEANAAPLYSVFPEASMFVVPSEAVVNLAGNLLQTHTALIRFMAKNAVTWMTPGSVPTGTRDYVVFVFLADRVSPSAELQVKISAVRGGTGGFGKATRYLDVKGWRIAILTGQFALSDEPYLYVKAVFSPGAEIDFGSRTPRLVGLFSTDPSEKPAATTGRLLEIEHPLRIFVRYPPGSGRL